MNRLYLIAGIALLLFALGGVIYWQYSENQQLITRAVDAEKTSIANAAALAKKEADADAQRESILRLIQQQHGLNDLLFDRQSKIAKLERENEDYRNWANTQLPDAAARLRQRPAITGADEYKQYLSTRDTLPPASNQPDSQRPADDRSGAD